MPSAQHDHPRADCPPALTGYWLRHCDGFQVFGPNGRIGFVERVDGHGDTVDLVIAAGLFRNRTLVARERDVDELDVAHRRLVVSGMGRRDASPAAEAAR